MKMLGKDGDVGETSKGDVDQVEMDLEKIIFMIED
jgi:hypothetical protein